MSEDNKQDAAAGAPDAAAGAPDAAAAKPEDATTPSPELTAAADNQAPFVDDIIIWQEGLDAPRKLTQAALQALPKLPTSMLPPINSLIKQGVTIAAIPTTSGIGAACYLVNLATLKRPDDEE